MTPALRRRALMAAAGAAPLARPAAAQSGFPDRPVRVIVSYGAGGAVDTLARLVMPRVSLRLGQPIVVENRPGAGGTVAAAAVARSRPDGYTLLDDGSSFAVNPSLIPNLPYDPRRDFVPIGRVATIPNVLLLGPGIAVNTVPELIAFARANPGRVDCSSTGVGSGQHLGLEMLNRLAGLRINHVTYRDQPSALNDLRAGRIAMACTTATSAIPVQGRDGLRVIGHGGDEAIAALPGVPRIADTLPGYRSEEWQGVYAPAGLPPEIAERLNRDLMAALAEPAIVERFAALGAYHRAETVAEFTAFVDAELRRAATLVAEANIRL